MIEPIAGKKAFYFVVITKLVSLWNWVENYTSNLIVFQIIRGRRPHCKLQCLQLIRDLGETSDRPTKLILIY